MSRAEGRPTLEFGERFSRGAALAMACLALFTITAVVVQGASFPFIAVAVAVALSWGFRRRFAHDEQRPRRTLEDERDHAFVAGGDRVFRVAASTWMVGLSLALALPALRETLLAAPLRVPGLLLLGVIVANMAGHARVALSYRRDRQ